MSNWRSGSPFLKRVAGYRLKLESGRSDLSKYATELDLVNVSGKADVLPSALWAVTWLTVWAQRGKSRCVPIGFWNIDLCDYRRNWVGKAIFELEKQSSFIQKTIIYSGADCLQKGLIAYKRKSTTTSS